MKKLIVPTILIALTASPVAMAKNGYQTHHGARSDWAKVIKVEPISRMVEHNSPSQECWNEQVRYRATSKSNDSYTGTILGGVIGGALGNAVGRHKTNKRIGTAVGAILGASVGHDLSSSNRPYDNRVRYRNERRCSMHDNISYQEEVVGYQVWYRYFGEKYKTRMDTKPGNKIKVRVKVEPF